MKHKIYISGPMTGLPNYNFEAFNSETERLRSRGHDVINPAELCVELDPAASWQECMRVDIAALVTCSAIHLLPGWRCSKGATLEYHIAERLGMEILGAVS